MSPKNPPIDDPASAPESGTDRDETSGNAPAAPQHRPGHSHPAPGPGDKHSKSDQPRKDDPTVAGEER